MKRILSPALLFLALAMALTSSGCKTSATAPPLAPGYNNPADQQMGSILAGARALYEKIRTDSASGATTLSQAEKDAFNRLGVSINLAEQIYLAYHAGTATQAQAQAAVNTVQQNQAAVPIPKAGILIIPCHGYGAITATCPTGTMTMKVTPAEFQYDHRATDYCCASMVYGDYVETEPKPYWKPVFVKESK